MSVFDETPREPSSRTPLVVGGLAVVALLAGGAFLLMRGPDEKPAATPTPAAAARPSAAPGRKAAPPTAALDAANEAAAAKPSIANVATAPAAAPVADAVRADTATLVVESDVAGASVFVNREFVGTAPVTLKNVAPGSTHVNLSAEGYDGVQREVEVAPGDNTVMLRFKEVRLNTSVGVAHKHGMGGCDGTLRATVDGLVYETANKSDAFSIPYAQLETFEVNYLDKNLRVKQRGGKTWNFTDKAADNADKLFVFHREVSAARDKLAKGFTATR